jgi:hypothetical protein
MHDNLTLVVSWTSSQPFSSAFSHNATGYCSLYCRYKDLEAAQAEGVTFSFLPPSTTIPNGTLLCNGKSARDRNRKVAPMIISEKFGMLYLFYHVANLLIVSPW